MGGLIKKTGFCFIPLFLLMLNQLAGQFKSIGVPEIINIPRQEYGADAQNWDIIQDNRGILYLGNKDGILTFDGEDWETMPVSNHSMVRSLAVGSDGRIYVGAYNEIGVMERSSRGQLMYSSLNHLVPDESKDYDDVWNVYQTRFGLIFQCFEYVFIYQNDTIQVLKPGERFGYSYYLNNNFYVVEKGIGLRVLVNGELVTLSDDPLFTVDEIHSINQINSDDLLIGSLSNGLYILHDQVLDNWGTEISAELEEHKLYCGTAYKTMHLFGTIKNGLYVVDESGKIRQHLNRSSGLQNNTVLSLFIDDLDNVWLGLDNGIDYLKTSLPLSYLNYNFNIETAYATMYHDGRLYVGTNQGLFTILYDELENFTDVKFDLVKGTDGQVWNLAVHDGQLLCGHNSGAYLVEGTTVKKITNSRGIWNFVKVPGRDDLLLSGTYDGLVTFSKGMNGKWTYRDRIKGLKVSSRELVMNDDGTIWMSHEFLGLYRIVPDSDLDSITDLQIFKSSHYLPESLPYVLHQLEGNTFFSTTSGIYQYDESRNLFYRPDDLNRFFDGIPLLYFLREDSRGNLWYSSDQGMGLFRLLEDGTFTKITTPFKGFSDAMNSPFDNIYIQDPENIFVGTQNGLVHYDPTMNKDYFYDISAYIRSVFISLYGTDSLWSASGNVPWDEQADKKEFSLPYSHNNISFEYYCPDPENTGHIEYSYRLDHFEEDWSEWNPVNRKEYTNLREGNYFFEVRARNLYGQTSSADRFYFLIEPPFYRSRTALVIYLSLGLGVIVTTVFIFLKRVEKVRSQEKMKHTEAFQKKEEKLQEQRLAAEKKVVQLRNEKLQAEMKHKNKELATSTYHIIQTNKFLNTLKQELAKLSQSAKSELVMRELKKISRKIDRDIQNEKNWEVFDRYFDEVHQEFLTRIKERHPDLTPKELRLSAYLRMNISTKEIAPLMNISVRGVEISRYRLRKKLKLDRDTNLTEYIMQIL